VRGVASRLRIPGVLGDAEYKKVWSLVVRERHAIGH
jgi:hypothetical protein